MKRTFTLLSMLIAGLFSASAQMSGTYTIGGTTPNFTTIQEACDSLKSQGVSGAVVLDIRDGAYSEAVVLDSVSGVSAANTITFQSENLDSSKVSISNTSTPFTCKVNFVRLNQLSVIGGTAYGVDLRDASDMQITNCAFSGTTTNYAIHGVNYNALTGKAINNFMVSNSLIIGFRGIYLDAENIDNFSVTNTNIATTSYGLKAYADRTLSNVTITGDSVLSTSGYAVYLEGYYTKANNINVSMSWLKSSNDVLYIYSDYLVSNVNIDGVMAEGRYPASGTATVIYIDADYDGLDNININKTTVDSAYYGIYTYSGSGDVKNVTIDSCNSHSYYEAIYVYSSNEDISSCSVTNSISRSDNDNAIYIYADNKVDGVTLNNDSAWSNGDDAIYIYASNLFVNNVNLNHVYAHADTTSSSYEGLYLYASSSHIQNSSIRNSYFKGGRGIYMQGDQNITNFTIDSVMAHGTQGYGLYMYVDYNTGKNINILNSNFSSSSNYAAYIYGSDGRYDGLMVNNSDFTSTSTSGLYVDIYAGLSNAMFKNLTVQGDDADAGYIYCDYGGMRNVTVDSCTFNVVNGSGDALYISGYYTPGMDNVTVSNCDFNISGGSSGGEGMYAYSDSEIRNFTAKNNNLLLQNTGYHYGIDIEGYSGTSHIIVDNNTVKMNGDGGDGTGFYLYYLDSNIRVTNNMVDTTGSQSYIDEGMYITADYQSNPSGLWIENNNIYNAYYGLDLEYGLSDITVRNNTIMNMESTGGYGLYMYETGSGNLEVTKNKFLNIDEDYALYFDNVPLDTNSVGIVANNFFSNYNYGGYFYKTTNLTIANNSFTTPFDNNFFDISSASKNINFYNNVIKVDSASYSSDLFYFDDIAYVGSMNNNVTNIDTSNADYAYDSFNGTSYASIFNWNQATGQDANSFYTTVSFLNDTSDLHIDCNNSVLVAGMSLPQVTTDIDGNTRASVPTIGADEILATTGLLGDNDTAYICKNAIKLDAGTSSGAVTYLWSTGATTQTIWVSTVGVYSATLTDGCGTHTGSITVDYQNKVVANFSANMSFLTASFNNTSSNATSYSWNFGDGSPVSNQMNPVHVYSGAGSYTVTLIAMGACNNDTTTMVISPSTVGMNENASFVGLNVYPNPSNGLLTLSVDSDPTDDVLVRVVSVSGQVVYEQAMNNSSALLNHSIDITAYPAGMYFVNVVMNGETSTVRIVKQ